MTTELAPVAAPAAATVPTVIARVSRAPWRSPGDQPAWARPTLLVLAVAAGVLYGWGAQRMQLHLYYGPAVKSMSSSWTAFLFAAYDPQATTTIDKLPGAFWLQALSARIFGFHAWSVLLPQILASVLSILVLYRVVRRWIGPHAAILAAAALATMPIVAALARTQISDVLLILLLLLAVDAWQQAVTDGRLAPLLLCGIWIGLAFQTKMVQAWAIWPAFLLTYLFAVRTAWTRRLACLALAGVVSLAVSFAWVAPMLLLPASARPYIDGSTDNSVLSMVFGYNGFNRYGVGNDGAQVLGVGGPVGKPGTSPWLYVFSDGVAPQVGWLYPLALVGLVAGLLWIRRDPGTDDKAIRLVRAGYLMWGIWLLTHVVAFSVSRKPHTFYIIALSPAVAALAGAGLALLWTAYRHGGARRWLLPAAIAATCAWGVYLAGRFPDFYPWLTPTLLTLAGISVIALIAVRGTGLLRARTQMLAAGLGLAAVLLAPAAWATSVMDNTGVVDAHRPAAGPTSLETASVLSGRMRRVLPAAEITRIMTFLRANNAGQPYLIAVQWAPQAGPFILNDVPVLPIGGFTAQVPTMTATQLDELATDGSLRFALVDGPEAKGMVTPDYPDYRRWAESTCAPVDGFTNAVYTLYDCQR